MATENKIVDYICEYGMDRIFVFIFPQFSMSRMTFVSELKSKLRSYGITFIKNTQHEIITEHNAKIRIMKINDIYGFFTPDLIFVHEYVSEDEIRNIKMGWPMSNIKIFKY